MRKAIIDLVGRDSGAYDILRASYSPFSRLVTWCYLRAAPRFARAPISIGGAPRSGTTLLLSVLSAHPSLFAINHETFAFCPRATDPEFATPEDFELQRVYTPLALSRQNNREHFISWLLVYPPQEINSMIKSSHT